MLLVNCGDPVSLIEGLVGNYTHTREGATAIFQCDEGFRPSAPMVSTCTTTGDWVPEILLCTLITGELPS